MSIKQRLAFGFGAVLAVFAIAALILSREMASDRRMTERIADDFSTHVAAAHTLASAAEIAATSLHGYALTGEQDLLEAYKRSAARRQAAIGRPRNEGRRNIGHESGSGAVQALPFVVQDRDVRGSELLPPLRSRTRVPAS